MNTWISKILYAIISKLAPLLLKLSFSRLNKNFEVYCYLRKHNLIKLKDEFDTIYIETLYQLISIRNKDKQIVLLFENEEVRKAFREEIYQKNNYSFVISLDSNLHTNPKYRKLKNIKVDIENEIKEFKKEFIKVTNEARTPSQLGNSDSINKLSEKIDQLLDLKALNEKFRSDIEIRNQIIYSKSEVHQLVDHVSQRELLVQEYIQLFSGHRWVSIMGSISTGKSQLAVLITKKFERPIYWINLRGFDDDNYIFKIFLDLSHHLSLTEISDFSLWSRSILDNIKSDSLIVLDDLPKLTGRESADEKFITFVNDSIKKGINLLSTSNYEIPIRIRELTSSNVSIEKTIPLLSIDEVNEILLSFGLTPEYSSSLKTFIYSISSGHPIIARAICDYLNEKKWAFTHQEISELFSGEYANGLTSETYEIISKTITDSKTKDLLYRLKLVIGSFTLNEVTLVSNCPPIVDNPIERFNKIKGLWVQQVESNKYDLSPLISIIKAHNLNPDLEYSIYYSLAKKILETKVLDQFDARIAISYFISSKSYNDAGFVLIKVLNESLKYPKLYFDWGLNLFWYSLPLPKEMDLALQVYIRVLQIFLNRQENRDLTFLVSDLENICESAVKKGIELGAAYLLLSYYYAIIDSQKALKYLMIGTQSYNALLQMSGLETKITSDFSHETMAWGSVIDVNTIQEIETWFDTLENLSDEQIKDIQSSEHSDIGSVIIFKKIYEKEEKKPFEDQNWENVISIFKRVQERATSLKLDLLIANAVRYIVNIMSEKLKEIDSAHNYAKTFISILSNNATSRFLVNDAIGRQLFYNGNSDDAVLYIAEAVEINVSDFYIEKLDTYLVLSQILGKKDSKVALFYSKKAKELVTNSPFANDILRSKVIGEYATSLYLNNDIRGAIYALEEGYQILVDSYNLNPEYHITIIRYGHVLNYWYNIISKGMPPDKDVEGNDYEPPSRGLFLNSFKEDLLNEFYFPERRFIVSLLMFNCFEFYLDFPLTKKWAYYNLSIHRDIEFNHFSLVLGYIAPYQIIDKKYLEAINLQIEVIDKTNNLLEDENSFVQISKNKNVQDILNSRPKNPIKGYDVSLVEFAFTPIFLDFLSQYLDKDLLSRNIQNLEEIFNNIDDHFKDKSFLECLKKMFAQIKSQEKAVNSIIRIQENYSGEFEASLKTILFLFASIYASCNQALSLHLALINRLETIYSKASRGTYFFILLPFFEKFWLYRINQNENEFFEISFLHSKSLPFYNQSPPTKKIRNLFRILSNHLNYNLSTTEEDWMEN